MLDKFFLRQIDFSAQKLQIQENCLETKKKKKNSQSCERSFFFAGGLFKMDKAKPVRVVAD